MQVSFQVTPYPCPCKRIAVGICVIHMGSEAVLRIKSNKPRSGTLQSSQEIPSDISSVVRCIRTMRVLSQHPENIHASIHVDPSKRIGANVLTIDCSCCPHSVMISFDIRVQSQCSKPKVRLLGFADGETQLCLL